jgi:hypothetical protein
LALFASLFLHVGNHLGENKFQIIAAQGVNGHTDLLLLTNATNKSGDYQREFR